MTRALALLFLLCAAGCATTNGTLVSAPLPGQASTPTGGVRPDAASAGRPLSVLADSAWLHFACPRFGSYGCEPDTTLPLRGGMTVRVLRLNTVTPPFYRRGIEADSAGWDSVRAFNVPQEIARLVGRAPGERCSVRAGAGQYVVRVDGQRCPAWRVVRVP